GRGLHARSGARAPRPAEPSDAKNPMKIRLLWAAAVPALYAQTFRDPASPVAQTPLALPAQVARANPSVRFHATPKPLPAGAVTSDWASFLGPSHNGTSPETKLLRDWPKSGPTLLWEMEKGTGYSSPAI